MLHKQIAALFVLLSVSGFLCADSQDERIVFSSGDQRVALIELFTSEGCSSCPPADRWLSGLKKDSGLFTDYVPIAFHVDYWDYIGWKDRFSKPEFSDRQRRHAREGGARVVYTPGFFRHGKDWRGWRKDKIGKMDEFVVGNLDMHVDGQHTTIRFVSSDPSQRRLVANVALLGMNLETSVLAGENEGRKLRHDFVALNIVDVPLVRSGSAYEATIKTPEADVSMRELALAAWISEAGSQAPLQSVGGFLPTPL
ncbi:MAG: DUF1223 domain-containing protein [Woeseiaceae bacterium]